MGAEFVVDASLTMNPKFKDLSRRLASPGNAMHALIKLWSFCAIHRPNGDLTDVEIADIPLSETEWAALMSARGPRSFAGFLEVVDGKPKLHHWDRSGRHQESLERRRRAAKIAGAASAEARREATDEEWSIARTAVKGRESRLRAVSEDDTDVDILSNANLSSNDRSERTLKASDNGENDGGIAVALKGTSSGVSDLLQTQKTTQITQPALFDDDTGTRPFKPQKKISSGSRAMEEWLDSGFEWFYSIYPRHVSRADARKAWGQLHRELLVTRGCKGLNRAVWKRIAEHIQRQLDTGEWDPGNAERRGYIPYPASYLRGKRWED